MSAQPSSIFGKILRLSANGYQFFGISSGLECWDLTGGALRVESLPVEALLFLGKQAVYFLNQFQQPCGVLLDGCLLA
jgi:hypothetical protein